LDSHGLDRFKTINDTHGHDAGDTVLKAFAEILQTNTRQSNMCARLGGEEFVLVLTHLEQIHIAGVVDRIRRQVESRQLSFNGRPFSATASFGVAGFCGTVLPDFGELLARADAALYSAKQKGRNRMEFSS
jgi:diguanylate cyclase (GGDEF)-like protein